ARCGARQLGRARAGDVGVCARDRRSPGTRAGARGAGVVSGRARSPGSHRAEVKPRTVVTAKSAVHTASYSPGWTPNLASGVAMPLCFIEPQDAIRVIAESVGREARRQLAGEVVRAWVDDIPDQELPVHYAKAIADLDEDDLHLLAAWH